MKIEEIGSYPLLAEYSAPIQINDMIQYVVQTLEDMSNEDLVDINDILMFLENIG